MATLDIRRVRRQKINLLVKTMLENNITFDQFVELGQYDDIEFLNGMESALIGVGLHNGQQVSVYDLEQTISALTVDGAMTYDKAKQFLTNWSKENDYPGSPVFIIDKLKQ